MRTRLRIPVLIGLVLAAAFAAFGQTPIPTPMPTPDEPPPKQPEFSLPARPTPTAERVGVQIGNERTLSLPDAIEMALKNNNDINVSRKDARISDYGLLRARGAWDPLLAAQTYYQRATTPTASAIGGAVNGSVTQSQFYGDGGVTGNSPFFGGSYSALLTASRTTTSNTNSFLNPQYPSALSLGYTQPLWRNFSIDANRRQLEVARKTIQITDSQLTQKAMDVIASVEQAYWDLVYTLRNLQVQRDTLAQSKEQLESNKRLVDKGVLAPIEIVAAEAQVAVYEQNVYAAQESVTTAENLLKTQLLIDRTSPEWSQPLVPVTPIASNAPQIGLEVAVTEALKNRPELAQLAINKEINRLDQKFYRNQTKPQIDLVGTYTSNGLAGSETAAAINPATGLSRVPPNLVGGLGNSLVNLLQQDYPTYRAGVVISLPFGNKVAKANLGESIVTGERLDVLSAQAEQAVEAQVRNSLQALRSAESSLAAASAQRMAAEELYNSEQRQFRAGASTFYLVLQRQTDLATARGREIQAQTDLSKAISIFNRAIGKTLDVNNVVIDR